MSPRSFDPLISGVSLLVFAISVLGGTFAGGKYRYSWALMEAPWGDKEEDIPITPQEAWAWISFANDALAFGVRAEEVKKIYRKTKDSGVPLDMKNLPWPSYSHGNKDESSSPHRESETPPVRPSPPRPGPSPV